jgi:hypothetical protein
MSTTNATEKIVRVVTLPVREVDGSRVLDAFRDAWRLSTDLANWCQRELALHDPGARVPGAERMARYVPKCLPGERSLYQWVNHACPFRDQFAGCAGSMGAVIKAVEDAWRSHPRFGRFAVLWRGESRPCVFQYPYPWPVRSQELRIMRGAEDRPRASITLPGGRVSVRLADGGEFRRQLRQFDTLLADVSRIKQAKITGRWNSGRLVGADLRLVGAFDPASERSDTVCAVVTTGPTALLTVEVDGRSDPFIYHGDDLRAVIAQHDGWRHRLAVDLKHEKRWPAAKRAGIVNGPAVQARMDKARNRLRTARQQAAACVAGFLTRQGVGAVVYRDADKTFLPRFDWTGLRELVRCKCEENGIAFQHEQGAEDE